MRYGIDGTLLDNNVVRYTRQIEAVKNARGVPLSHRHFHNVTVLLASYQSDTIARQKDFSRQEWNLRSLLSKRNRVFAFYHDDGTPTDAVLTPVGSISGTDCLRIDNPEEGRGEYTSQRTMRFVVTGTYPVGDPRGALVDFKETLTFQGDGAPPWEDECMFLGTVVRMVYLPKSRCFAFQSGSATGYLDYPKFGGPHGAPVSFWPQWYKSELSRYTLGDAVGDGDTLTNYPLSWSYTHARWGTPFTGIPHQWK